MGRETHRANSAGCGPNSAGCGANSIKHCAAGLLTRRALCATTLAALGLAFAAALALAAGCDLANWRDQPVLVFSADDQGVIAACGCPSNPSGGLAKRDALVETFRCTRPAVLLVDAGDLMPPKPSPIKEKYVALAAARGGYDAIALGDQEFVLGVDRLRELKAQYKLPFLCANVRDASGQTVFPPDVIRTVPSPGRRAPPIKVGIFAVVADRAYGFPPLEWRKGLAVEPPIEAARREVEFLTQAGCDFLVALSHQELEDSRAMAAAVPGIDVVVCGHDERVLPKGERVGKTLLVSTGESGRIMGSLAIGQIPEPEGRPPLALAMTELSAQVPDAPAVMDLYWQYVKEARDKPPPDWDLTPIPPVYDTAEACMKCHAGEYKSWSKTAHARAFDSIRKSGRQDDPECVLCHTLGYGRKGGFESMAAGPALGRVTCQACHIVAADHGEKKVKAPDPRIYINSRLCMSCHGPVQSPEFDYFTYKPRIVHKPK